MDNWDREWFNHVVDEVTYDMHIHDHGSFRRMTDNQWTEWCANMHSKPFEVVKARHVQQGLDSLVLIQYCTAHVCFDSRVRTYALCDPDWEPPEDEEY